MLGRFSEDLTALQRAIRFGDGDTLFRLFTEARAVRRGIIEAGQDTAAPDFGRQQAEARRSPHERARAHASSMAEPHELWVFAYGSLMWRPGFPSEEIVHARLVGWRRCFCIYSVYHRGSPQRPGPGAGARPRRRVRGLAYRVAPANAAATLAYLRDARAGHRRLSRGAGAGDADDAGAAARCWRWPTSSSGRTRATPARCALVRAGAAHPRGQRALGHNIDYLLSTLRASGRARHPRARARAAAWRWSARTLRA